MVKTRFVPKGNPRFKFTKKTSGVIALRVDEDMYGKVMEIAKSNGVSIPSAAIELLRVGIEEYEKE